MGDRVRCPGDRTAPTPTALLLFPLENEPASPLVSGIIDYNMPLTSTYLKQMKLRVMNSQEQVSAPLPSAAQTPHPHLEAPWLA